MPPKCTKEKTGTVVIRDLEEGESFASQRSQSEEQGDQSPLNEDDIAKIDKFVNEHPSIFEQLGRYFKKKGSQNIQTSAELPSLVGKKVLFKIFAEKINRTGRKAI